MKVEFWFDPACPFCWLTSRWLTSVAPQRSLDISWRPISLMVKNDLKPGDAYYDACHRTHQLLRVCESLRAAGHADRIGDVYREFGTRIHNESTSDFDVAAILLDLGLNPTHAEALEDDTFDEMIRHSMSDGLALVGNDVGTPIIAVEVDGTRRGFFGPVINALPSAADALKLWDGYLALVSVPSFYEIKRTRSGGLTMPPAEPR